MTAANDRCHRRSSFVGHAASPETTRGCGVLHFFDYVLRGAIRAVGWAIDVAGGAARADVFSRGAIAYHILTGRPPVTNPFDLPSRLREGNGLLLSGTMNGAGRWLEEVVRLCADRSTAPPAALDFAAALSWSVSDTDCGLIKNSPPTGRPHKS